MGAAPSAEMGVASRAYQAKSECRNPWPRPDLSRKKLMDKSMKDIT